MSNNNNNNNNNNTKNPQSSNNQDQVGEGNRDADRRYREGTQKYVDSGRSEEAGREARRSIEDDEQRRDLEEAERRARQGAPQTPGRDQHKSPGDRDGGGNHRH